MRLTVLGAGPAYTDRDGATGACYLVSLGSTSILLDLGQGSFPRIFRHLRAETLDAVLVSHLHPDHYIDLVALRHYLRWEFTPPRRMRVLAPSDLANRLDHLHRFPGFTGESFDVQTMGTGPHRVGDLTITATLVTHTDESYAIRVAGTSGRGLVYSGDCGAAMDIAPLVRPGDVLLAEASFGPGPSDPGAKHLDGPEVGRLARATNASLALLTHLQMGYDPDATVAAAQAEYDGPVRMVWPGSVEEI